MRTPTPKKSFGNSSLATKSKNDLVGLDEIFKNFFADRNCTQMYQLLNKYSVVDGILSSGTTGGVIVQIIIEYKGRLGHSIADYPSVILERDKYDAMIELQRSLNAPASFYITEFDDAVVIHCLDPDKRNYPWEYQELPESYNSFKTKTKAIAYLDYNNATWVIGKRLWQTATPQQLERYLTAKKKERIK